MYLELMLMRQIFLMYVSNYLLSISFFIVIFFAGVVYGYEEKTMKLTSSAFKHNEMIPPLYTCDGKDISPPLMWDEVPEGVKSFALICDDPDAPMGTWVHWVTYNIKSGSRELPAKVLVQEKMLIGGFQGINDFGKIGYGGPCPPSGIHRYFFKLYALDSELNLQRGVTKKQLEDAMKGHIIAVAELIGKYKKK